MDSADIGRGDTPYLPLLQPRHRGSIEQEKLQLCSNV